MATQPTPNLAPQNYFSTTLSAGCTSSDTTIYLSSLPTSSEGYLVIDPDNSSKEIIYYNAKGANFVTVPTTGDRGLGGTSAVAHSSGASVKSMVNAEFWTALQQGYSIAYGNGWLPAAGTWTYASATTMTVPQADADRLNAGSRIKLDQTTTKYFYVTGVSGTTITVNGGTDYTLANAAITSPYFSNDASPKGFPQWFAFTPSWTNLTVGTSGNTYNTGYFSMSGKTVSYRLAMIFGSSGPSMGSAPVFVLPVAPNTGYYRSSVGLAGNLGYATLLDSGVTEYFGFIRISSADQTKAEVLAVDASATYGRVGNISATVPFSWGSGDGLFVTGNYEAA